jgi:hypothetical protein
VNLGQGEPETTTQFRDAAYVGLALVAWVAFNELTKVKKGKKSFLDRWMKK